MNLIKITLASALGLVLIAPGADAQQPVPSKDKPNVERVQRQKDGPKARGTERKDAQRPEKQRPDTKRPEVKRPEKERPDAKRPDKQRPDGLKGKQPSEAELVKKGMQEEAKHRDRLAKLKRLRELTEKKGDRGKVAKIDKLEAAENARYDRMIAQAKRMLGEAKFNEIHAKMKSGRGTERPEAKRPDGERPEVKRPADERPTEKRPTEKRP